MTWEDRFYPKAWGHPLLRQTIADYYNTYYRGKEGCDKKIAPENAKTRN